MYRLADSNRPILAYHRYFGVGAHVAHAHTKEKDALLTQRMSHPSDQYLNYPNSRICV